MAFAISNWFKTFAGTSALDIAYGQSLEHDEVLGLIEELCEAGYGTLNRDVELVQLSFGPQNIEEGFKYEYVTTHIFFPSKNSLQEAFFASDLRRQNLPEYTRRLHLGAHQIGLVFFSEEVLSQYMSHPEHYEVNDTLAGGDVTSLSAAPEGRSLYVRYGKSRQGSGRIAVTAIFKDLAAMSPAEQCYWHSYEFDAPDVDKSDPHFQRFLSRTYDGECVDFPDPILDVIDSMSRINRQIGLTKLFTRQENSNLHLPVKQTYKCFCDSASELYKVAGPDGVCQTTLKNLLRGELAVSEDDLVHKESSHPLSTMQLLELVESKLGIKGAFTKPLRKVAEFRIDADHRVLLPDGESKSYSQEFAALCSELATGLASVEEALMKRRQ